MSKVVKPTYFTLEYGEEGKWETFCIFPVKDPFKPIQEWEEKRPREAHIFDTFEQAVEYLEKFKNYQPSLFDEE